MRLYVRLTRKGGVKMNDSQDFVFIDVRGSEVTEDDCWEWIHLLWEEEE
ncbi:hypothetical protein DNHGIG_40320 [Collibacillus ludicampi]|uniref:Uncharacterized protein n=1 Tax=Collibacillus ludicampi TaxID=2771369 RepID=A0AAV4LL45_9BACL|nr:hypothetical protein DNHGIG_40320 [Collibacillus ludicampi]